MDFEQNAEIVCEIAKRIGDLLNDKTHQNLKANFSNLRYLLESPFFARLCRINRSVEQLGVLSKSYNLDSNDFDIDRQTGELELFRDIVINNDNKNEKETGQSKQPQIAEKIQPAEQILNNGSKNLEEDFRGGWVDKVTLRRGSNLTLGLSLTKMNGENVNLNGIFVEVVQEGSIAERDGRLRPGDQVLAINEQLVEPSMSNEEFLELLEKNNEAIELIIRRSALNSAPNSAPNSALPGDERADAMMVEKEPVGKEPEEEDEEVEKEMVEIVPIHLVNDGSGLGFGIVRKPESGGVMVKTVLPGSVAAKEGGLQTGDHILRIENCVVKDMTTSQVATILKHSGVNVNMTVGRTYNGPPGPHPGSRVVVPARQVEDVLTMLNSGGTAASSRKQMNNDLHDQKMSDGAREGVHEVEIIKDSGGLGMTINGYHSPDGSTFILVSELVRNGAAERSGRIRVGDEILEVNGIPFRNTTNAEATAVLRNTGARVLMKVRRRDSDDSTTSKEVTTQPLANGLTGHVPKEAVHKQDSGTGSDSGSEVDRKILELQDFWKNILGQDCEIVVAKVIKKEKNSSLGITMNSKTKGRTSAQGEDDNDDGDEDDEDDKTGDRKVKEYFHYLHEIKPDGPVGLEGSLRPGDRLLQVDSHALINLPHDRVASIIRGLDTHIFLVCARLPYAPKSKLVIAPSINVTETKVIEEAKPSSNFMALAHKPQIHILEPPFQQVVRQNSSDKQNGQQDPRQRREFDRQPVALNDIPKDLAPSRENLSTLISDNYRLQGSGSIPGWAGRLASSGRIEKEVASYGNDLHHGGKYPPNSEMDFSSEPEGESSLDMSSGSQALREFCESGWQTEPTYVDLVKGDRGLGFSVIAFENPGQPSENSLLIRGLMPGGLAEADGRLEPGDKIISVNDFDIHDTDMQYAVDVIKMTPKGLVRIGVLKPIKAEVEDIQQPIRSPEKTSFDFEAPPLSPPLDFSSKYIINHEKNVQTPQDKFHPVPQTRSQANGFTTKTTTGAVANNNIITNNIISTPTTNNNIPIHSFPLHNLKLSPVSSVESFETMEKKESQGKVASLRKAFEAQHDVEKIFRQHFPIPVSAKKSSVASSETRLVDIHREENQGLGISIVGGSTSINRSAGVFIKNVFPGSPAGSPGKLRNGDQILEVNGINCREATHEQVVEIIKSASNPIWFLVQNIQSQLPQQQQQQQQLHQQQQQQRVPSKWSGNGTTPHDYLQNSQPEEADDTEQKYGHLDGEVISLEIDLGNPRTSLGLILTGNKNLEQMNTFVAAVQPGSAADFHGGIIPGDELLEINEQTLQERSHLNVSYIIKTLKTQIIKIVLLRNPANIEKMALNPKSPLLTPRLNANKMPRRSVGDVLVNEKLPSESFLSVGFDNLKRAKSAEFLAIPGSLSAASPANSSESINTAGNALPEINGGLTNDLEKKLPVAKESPIKQSTPKHSENLMTVEIPRGDTGLGISIIGGSDTLLGAIIINDIFTNGAVDKDGRLKVGDVLIKVNNSSLENVTRETAMKLLKQGPSDVTLVVSRPKEDLMTQEENFETFNVDLNKRPGQNLGLTIIGKHRDSSVCIHELLKGGLAEAEGRLKPGDEIMLINKKSFKGQEAAAELLKSAPGMVRLTVRRPWTKKAAAVNAGVPEKVQKRSLGAEVVTVRLSRFDRGVLMLLLEREAASQGSPSPVVVREIKGQESIARHFKVGDRVLSVNKLATNSMNLKEVMEMIQKCPGDVVFEISRGSLVGNALVPRSKSPTPSTERMSGTIEDEKRIKIVTLHRGSAGYGFSVVGGFGSPLGDLPVFVKNIFEDGVAARDGRLRRGDRLVAVNGESLEGLSHQEALAVLKNCEGTIVLTVLE